MKYDRKHCRSKKTMFCVRSFLTRFFTSHNPNAMKAMSINLKMSSFPISFPQSLYSNSARAASAPSAFPAVKAQGAYRIKAYVLSHAPLLLSTDARPATVSKRGRAQDRPKSATSRHVFFFQKKNQYLPSCFFVAARV